MFNYNEGRTMVLNIYTFILIFLCGTFVVGGLFFSKKENSVSSYLNASRSIRSASLTASIVASCFGVWILIGPAEAAASAGPIKIQTPKHEATIEAVKDADRIDRLAFK